MVVCHLDHSLVIPAPKTKNTVYNELFPLCGKEVAQMEHA
jgi:hypothetical protein